MTVLALLAACGPDGPGEPGPPPVGPPGPVEERAALGCGDPEVGLGPFAATQSDDGEPVAPVYLVGGGIAAFDADGDGLTEIVTARDGRAEYLTLVDGSWRPRPGLPDLDLRAAFGASAADPDGDGDLDLLITRWGLPNHFLRNDGRGVFTEATAEVGLAGPPGHHSGSGTWSDLDGDGDLDLVVGGHGFVDESGTHPSDFSPADPTLLYENRGDGTFADRTDLLPEEIHAGYTFMAGAADFDLDGDPDLLLVNDFGRAYLPGRLLWNQGGLRFALDGGAAGLDIPYAGMGLAFGEFDGDGRPDVLVPYWGGYVFMRSTPEGVWFDWSQAANLRPARSRDQVVGWGAQFGDIDNDGASDAAVMHGWIDTGIADSPRHQPNAVFRQVDGRFDNVSETLPPDVSDARGLALADLDADGALDLAFPDLSGPTRLMRGRCKAGRALLVSLEQPGMNRFGVGATLEVSDGAGWSAWRLLTAGGDGYGSSGPMELHVGVGDREVVDLRITWPGGEVQVLEGVETNRRLRIRR